MTKKILWFSRHAMTAAQRADLERALGGSITVTQISGSPANVHVPFEALEPEAGETLSERIGSGTQPALKELVKEFDEVAVVLPINMVQQLLPFLPSGRLLQAVSARILEDGGKVTFAHQKWQAITEVKIITEDL